MGKLRECSVPPRNACRQEHRGIRAGCSTPAAPSTPAAAGGKAGIWAQAGHAGQRGAEWVLLLVQGPTASGSCSNPAHPASAPSSASSPATARGAGRGAHPPSLPKAGWVAPGVHAGVPYPALRGPGMLTRVTARTHRAHPQTPPASLLESSHFTSSNESSGNGICPQALGGIPLPGSCVFTFPEQNADPSAASWLVPTRHGHISF